jgi:hypothetical protein
MVAQTIGKKKVPQKGDVNYSLFKAVENIT